MKNLVTPEMAEHLEGTVTTLCLCCRIERRDGEELFFTDHDLAVIVDGDSYSPVQGVGPSAIEQTADLAVDNLEVEVLIKGAVSGLTEADIAAHLYDHAEVDIFIVNWADTSMGKIWLAMGWTFSQITIEDNSIKVELRGKADKLNRPLCEITTPDCRATFGDARCKIDLEASDCPYRYDGTVSAVTDRRFFVDDSVPVDDSSAPVEIDDQFEYGLLVWQTGENAGREIEVRHFNPATFTFELFEPMPNDIGVGDPFSLTWGCDKIWTTCRDRFDNLVNFRGEPDIPGYDVLLDVERP